MQFVAHAGTLDMAVAIAYIAILTDLTLQIRRIWLRKSSGDVSIVGTIIRTTASFVFLAKYLALGDPYMTVGQSAFLALIAVYLFLLVSYRISSISRNVQQI